MEFHGAADSEKKNEKGSLVSIKTRLIGLFLGLVTVFGLTTGTASAQVQINSAASGVKTMTCSMYPYVGAPGVRVRSGPSLNANIIGKASSGERVDVWGYNGDWALVWFRFRQPSTFFGWIWAAYLRYPTCT